MTEDGLLAALCEIAGAANVLTRDADIAPYNEDSRKKYSGRARAVVRPANTAEVSAVVRICREMNVAIVPQGGNTGLAGGSTPDTSGLEVVLSLKRMNRVRAIDPHDNAMTVEAGCILHDLQELAREHGRLFPLSLAAEGSATIGGNLSTNAGGEQVLRYGNTRDLTLGLEVVLPDGRVWNGLSPLRKDNTGYDIKHLFIGGEGTLGVITAATLKLYPLPRSQATFWLGLTQPQDAVEMLTLLRDQLGDRVTAFELISRATLELTLKNIPGLRDPLASPCAWSVLAEVSESSPHLNIGEQVESVLAIALEQGIIVDAALASSAQQALDLWRIRDSTPEAQTIEGPSIKHDLSVPVSRIPEFIARTDLLLREAFPGIRLICFGHVGDGNLHYNQSKPESQSTEAFWASEDDVHAIVHAVVGDMHGSISAEHGVGRIKQAAFLQYEDPVALDVMRLIKNAIDPRQLFNPGRMLPRV